MLANISRELPERSDQQKFAKQDDQDQDKQELGHHTRKKEETDLVKTPVDVYVWIEAPMRPEATLSTLKKKFQVNRVVG